jgi:hypothetical protein
MKVLAQSYDWLLFLTDEGLASFLQKLVSGENAFGAVKKAFENSYGSSKKFNRFTKTTMDIEADFVLSKFFINNLQEIVSWFNVVAPAGRSVGALNAMLSELSKMEV